MDSYSEVDVYSEDTNFLEIPFVKRELEYLVAYGDTYQDELDEFYADIERAKTRGTGEACIEELFRLELVSVKSP
jgi:hypothetical protein